MLRRAVPKVGKDMSIVHGVTVEKELLQCRGDSSQQLQELL